MCIEKCLPQSKDTINGDNYFQMPLNSLKTNVTRQEKRPCKKLAWHLKCLTESSKTEQREREIRPHNAWWCN